MYRKDSENWLKHADFIILDMICLQIAYVLAYAVSGYGWNPYQSILYRNVAIFLGLADICVIAIYGTMKSVLKRGTQRNLVVTFNQLPDGRRRDTVLPVLNARGAELLETCVDADRDLLFWNRLCGEGALD